MHKFKNIYDKEPNYIANYQYKQLLMFTSTSKYLWHITAQQWYGLRICFKKG